MSRITARRIGWSIIGLCAFLSGSAAAQTQPSALPGVFSEVLDVRVINLEVSVTDKNGTPVLGLEAGDFRLLVDGEQVGIDYFSEVRGGQAVEPSDRRDVAAMPGVTPGEPIGTSFLVFIDDYFSIKRDRDLVLEKLADEAVRLLPEDRMAVVAYDGSTLEMLSSWSSSNPELQRALAAARERPAGGLERLVERRQFEATLGRSFSSLLVPLSETDELIREPAFGRELQPWERAYISRLTDQVNRTVAAATATLRSFAKPPGRKVLILLSGGWPFIPSDYVVNDLSRLLVDREGPYAQNLFSRLSETANLLGYTIYPVDVPGLGLDFAGSAEFARLPETQPGLAQNFLREREVQDTLRYLARETGGRALINAQRVEVLPRVVEDTRSYYWLGFTPVRARDDERHDVRVELSNPDLRVRLRSGFLDSSQETEVTMAVESALLFGSASASQSVQVELGPARAVESRQMEVPVLIRFDLGEVTFLPVADGFATELELRVAVLDERGRQAPIPVIPLSLRLPEIPSPGEQARYRTALRLRRMPHDAVVAIHDPASGRILTAGVRIEP